MATTKLEELKAHWRQRRAELVSRGLLADSSNPIGDLAKTLDDVIYEIEAQHQKVAHVQQRVHKASRQVRKAGRR